MSWSLDVESRELPTTGAVERFVRVVTDLILGAPIDVRVSAVPITDSSADQSNEFDWSVSIGAEPKSIMIFGEHLTDSTPQETERVGWWRFSIDYWAAPTAEQLLVIVLLGIAITTLGNGRLVAGDFGRRIEYLTPEELSVESLFGGIQPVTRFLRSIGFDEDRINAFSSWQPRFVVNVSDDARLRLAIDADSAHSRLAALARTRDDPLATVLGGPATTIRAIETAVEQERRGVWGHVSAEADQVVEDLAALFGEQICRAYGWSWCRLHWNVASPTGDYFDRFEALAVADPDLALVLRPERFLRERLALPADQPLRIVEHFASLAEGERATSFPDATRGALVLAE